MEKKIVVNKQYNTLEKVFEFLQKEAPYTSSMVYDSWHIRTDANGKMEKCICLKKSNMHGVKMYFDKENSLKVTYIIPNKIMHAYFGKSNKRYRNLIEIIAGKIKQALLANSQEKAFTEMTQTLDKLTIQN